ncbi:MAG: glycosyltransferase [Phaeodactylibacter sp.]|nr:glycosyltransferase [Phaeodactylibacter sp.]MCB9274869.1 glycosyltransferase [Lewinellaceae bacterium]
MSDKKRRVLFHRSWTKFNGGTSGGQLKVRDAFEHFRLSPVFEPRVYFGEETVWYDNPGNVWLPYRAEAEPIWDVRPDDVLFLAGRDWKVLSPEQRKHPPAPVLNIAQPRHTGPGDPRHESLKYPAIRIVKSTLGKQILEEYGVNGPVYLIPDTIDMSLLPPPNPEPDLDVLIVGLKNAEMAQALHRRLERRNFWRRRKIRVGIQVPPKLPTRRDFLGLVNRARIVAYLPLDAERGAEGFYLPALEGMALEKLVVCPFAVGNIDFCIAGETCLQPEYTERAIYRAILQALDMPEQQQREMIRKGKAISNNHRIEQERKALLDLLHQADEIWDQKHLFEFGN